MAEFDVFPAVIVGLATAVVGVITFFVYKLRILHRYIYKVGKFSVIFVLKNPKMLPLKIVYGREQMSRDSRFPIYSLLGL